MTIRDYAKRGDLDGIRRELTGGEHIDARDPNTDRTALMEAVSSPAAELQVVKFLLEQGADVNAKAVRPNTALNSQSIEGIDLSSLDPEFQKLTQDILADFALPAGGQGVQEDYVLSLAVSSGNFEKVKLLLDAGADVRYRRASGYTALIDALHGHDISTSQNLLRTLDELIKSGTNLNSVSDYGESALKTASRMARFDAVKCLLDAGADPTDLKWTPLMTAIAVGSATAVSTVLLSDTGLERRDHQDRTPWLLCVQCGDIEKATLLEKAGADTSVRASHGRTAIILAVEGRRANMLRWLLSRGFDPNSADDFKDTPLLSASENGDVACVTLLVDAGADIHYSKNEQPAIARTCALPVAQLLIQRGADLNEINDDVRAALTRHSNDGFIEATKKEFDAAPTRKFGTRNPEKMNEPFWQAMVKSGASAYSARTNFGDTDAPVWCFRRFGKSINLLPDSRIVEIGGEHEDHYDPDFCIYNDVIVHDGKGHFDIFGYPKNVFPPTDFHSATLVGNSIYIIGSLGYPMIAIREKHPYTGWIYPRLRSID